MSKERLIVYMLLLSGILLLSVNDADTFSNKVLSNDDFPFVGLRMVFIAENGYNETFVVSDENGTHYFVQLYTEGSLIDVSVISKDVTGTRTFSWYLSSFSQNMGGWVCWIDITAASIGDYVSLGDDSMFNITEQTIYSTNTTIYDV